MKQVFLEIFLSLFLVPAIICGQLNTSPPTSRIRLVFVHHSTGNNWLQNQTGTDGSQCGFLGDSLNSNNYYVSDTYYEWNATENSSIGSYTDIGHWYGWFLDETIQVNNIKRRDNVMASLCITTNQHASYYRPSSIPSGENEIIMIKSCFPNSSIQDPNGTTPADFFGRAYDYSMGGEGVHTTHNIKNLYQKMIAYFKSKPEKMFIIVTAPPLSNGSFSNTPVRAQNARNINNWLCDTLLVDSNWVNKNVYVFDFFTVLTGTDNHHRVNNGQTQRVYATKTDGSYYNAYPTAPGDDHPNATGNQKATKEFVPLLNVWYHTWQAWRGGAIQTPMQISPSNNAANMPVNQSLSWSAVAGALTYRVQLSLHYSFAENIVDDSTITETSRSLSALSNGTTYYWRVSAKNAGGTSSWSAVRSFSTVSSTPAVPSLSTPANNVTDQPVSLILSWSAVSGATGYRVQLSTNDTFSSTVINDSSITETSHFLSGLTNGTTYYWRVSAKNAGGTGLWSAVRSFSTVTSALAVPSLSTPANGAADQSVSLILSWSAVPGATGYRVQLSKNDTFSSSVIDDSTITETSRSLSGLSNGTTYYWRVSARNAGGTSLWSTVFKFTITPLKPAAVMLEYPQSNFVSTVDSVIFVWKKAGPSVSLYCFEIAEDSLTLTQNSASVKLIDSSVTDTFRLCNNLKYNQSYWWRVKAYNIAGWGEYSDVRQIVIASFKTKTTSDQFAIDIKSASSFFSMIKYSLFRSCFVSIKIYSLQGKLTDVLVDSYKQQGAYSLDYKTMSLPGGSYIIEFKTEHYAVRKRFSCVR